MDTKLFNYSVMSPIIWCWLDCDMSRSGVRECSHAGSWYSSDRPTLQANLERWLDLAKNDRDSSAHGVARAIIAPHAGYSYSGPTAAYAYKHMDVDHIERVFLLGPSHHVYMDQCALPSVSAYRSPLGVMDLDMSVLRQLEATGEFVPMTKQVDEEEHCLEMHLPFIQKIAQQKSSNVSLVPILVGSLDEVAEAKYGRILAPYLEDSRNFFIISSDFCHWGRRFRFTYHNRSDGEIYSSIDKLDKLGMNFIESGDIHGWNQYLKEYKNTICGRHPIGVFMNAIASTKSTPMKCKFIKYTRSQDVRDTNDSSVSYAAGVYVNNNKLL